MELIQARAARRKQDRIPRLRLSPTPVEGFMESFGAAARQLRGMSVRQLIEFITYRSVQGYALCQATCGGSELREIDLLVATAEEDPGRAIHCIKCGDCGLGRRGF